MPCLRAQQSNLQCSNFILYSICFTFNCFIVTGNYWTIRYQLNSDLRMTPRLINVSSKMLFVFVFVADPRGV